MIFPQGVNTECFKDILKTVNTNYMTIAKDNIGTKMAVEYV